MVGVIVGVSIAVSTGRRKSVHHPRLTRNSSGAWTVNVLPEEAKRDSRQARAHPQTGEKTAKSNRVISSYTYSSNKATQCEKAMFSCVCWALASAMQFWLLAILVRNRNGRSTWYRPDHLYICVCVHIPTTQSCTLALKRAHVYIYIYIYADVRIFINV